MNDTNIVSFQAKDFKNFSFTLWLKQSDVKTAAAGVAGSQQLGSFVADTVKKTNTEINQKNENSNNDFSGFLITLLENLDMLQRFSQILTNKNGVKGKEAISNMIKKNHQGSP